MSITNAPAGTYLVLGYNSVAEEDISDNGWLEYDVLSFSELEVTGNFVEHRTFELDGTTVNVYGAGANTAYGNMESFVSNPLEVPIANGVKFVEDPYSAVRNWSVYISYLDLIKANTMAIPVQWRYWGTLLEDSFDIYELEET